jgi:multidrug efflux pump subunit AcrA (membrane-fusion protein)
MKTHGIVVIISGLLLAGCRAETEEEKAPKPVVEVKTVKAEIADLDLVVRAPANIFPREQANITARITAHISRLYARKGQTVAAGQRLALLENRDVLAQQDSGRDAAARD